MHTRTRIRPARAAAVIGGVALLAASLTGCGSIGSLFGGAERDAETDEVTAGGNESVFDIQVGDCLLQPESTSEEIEQVEVVPCADPHDYEFFHEYELDLGDEWPGEQAIWDDADVTCHDRFETFVGVPFEESEALWYNYYSPTELSWNDGDRLIQCLVYEASDDQGQLVVEVEGTLENAQR